MTCPFDESNCLALISQLGEIKKSGYGLNELNIMSSLGKSKKIMQLLYFN